MRELRFLATGIAALLWLSAPVPLAAHPDGEEDANDFLTQYSETDRFRLGRPTTIHPTADGREILFLRSGARSFERSLWSLDVESGAERRLLGADALLGDAGEQLTDEERARRERQRLTARGITGFQLNDTEDRMLVPLSGRLFLVDRNGSLVREVDDVKDVMDARLSPDGRRIGFVRDGDLYVHEIDEASTIRLTDDATENITNGLAEFVAQEEMSRYRGFWWSPDSRRIAYQKSDSSAVERLAIADGTHPERRPRLRAYPRPGKSNAQVRLGIVAADGGETTWIDWDRERYEYLATVKWVEHAPLTLLVQNRQQTEELLLAVDLKSGKSRTLLVERDPAWLELEQRVPWWIDEGKSFLWCTEREGGLQLERRKADGSLMSALTTVDFGMQRFLHFDAGRNEALVLASNDPTQSFVYRVAIEPGVAPRRISEEAGLHHGAFSAHSRLWVHTHESPEGQTRWRVAGHDKTSSLELRSVAETPQIVPRLEFTTIGESPSFHAVIVRPRDFDVGRKYPVLNHVYGGPTSQMVRLSARRYLLDQWLADRGFIVIAIDARGTPGRGRDWQRAVRHDLIEIPLHDQAQATRALGSRYPEMDMDRVGIFGWSFGGYFSAMATMREGGLFKVGVAGAPVIAWEDYDTHYTERYMGLPSDNPEGYRAANVLTHAARLERPLLLIHGTADDNVFFMHSLKLADALFREGKAFEFLPLSGFTHMVPDAAVSRRLQTRIADFLAEHLTAGVARDGD